VKCFRVSFEDGAVSFDVERFCGNVTTELYNQVSFTNPSIIHSFIHSCIKCILIQLAAGLNVGVGSALLHYDVKAAALVASLTRLEISQ